MLKAKSTTYEFSLEEVKKAIAKEMNVMADKVEMEIVTEERGDDRFGSTYKEVTGVRVKVKS